MRTQVKRISLSPINSTQQILIPPRLIFFLEICIRFYCLRYLKPLSPHSVSSFCVTFHPILINYKIAFWSHHLICEIALTLSQRMLPSRTPTHICVYSVQAHLSTSKNVVEHGHLGKLKHFITSGCVTAYCKRAVVQTGLSLKGGVLSLKEVFVYTAYLEE